MVYVDPHDPADPEGYRLRLRVDLPRRLVLRHYQQAAKGDKGS